MNLNIALLLTLLTPLIGLAQPMRLPSAPDPAIAQFLEHALEGRQSEVLTALKGGMPVDQTDENGRTALMVASFNGHADVAQLLISNKANIHLKDSVQRTAIMYASTGPHLETVKLLVKHGARINDIDGHENWTPLMFAAAEGLTDIVNFLLAHDANPLLMDTDGDTAGDFAATRGHTELSAMLKKLEATISESNENPTNP